MSLSNDSFYGKRCRTLLPVLLSRAPLMDIPVNGITGKWANKRAQLLHNRTKARMSYFPRIVYVARSRHGNDNVMYLIHCTLGITYLSSPRTFFPRTDLFTADVIFLRKFLDITDFRYDGHFQYAPTSTS